MKPPAPSPPAPYRGIDPYRYLDRALFFGRSRTIEALFVKILLARLVIVFGESGAGKSSLINAGLIPALRKEGLHPERLRVMPHPQDPITVERIPSAEHPQLTYLPSLFENGTEGATPSPTLQCALGPFTEVLHARAEELRPVLIFDQFEELFTLFGQGNIASPEEERLLQRKILETILTLVNSDLKVKVVLIIREDFLGKLEALARDYPRVFDHRLRLLRLDEQEAREAILGPFSRAYIERAGHPFSSSLTASLANRLIQDLSRHEPGHRVQPTQLQIVCRWLWDRFAPTHTDIGLDVYEAEGGVERILEAFWRAELDRLSPPDRVLAVLLLSNLITEAGTRDVVSEDKLFAFLKDQPELADDPGRVRDMLALLDRRRFINQKPQRGTYYFEVASEYLIPLIRREGEALRLTQERARAAAQAERRLAEAEAEARRQAAEAEAEAQRLLARARARALRRTRFLAVIAVLGFLGALVASFYAFAQKQQTEQAGERIRLARDSTQALLDTTTALNRELGRTLDQLRLQKARSDSLARSLAANLRITEQRRVEILTLALRQQGLLDSLDQALRLAEERRREAVLARRTSDSLFRATEGLLQQTRTLLAREQAGRRADDLMDDAALYRGADADDLSIPLRLLQQADSLYRFARRPAGVVRALTTMSDLLAQSGRYATARDSLEAASRYQQRRGKGAAAELSERLGNVYAAWGSDPRVEAPAQIRLEYYRQARQHFQAALEATSSREDAARIYMKRGRLLRKEAQLQSASGEPRLERVAYQNAVAAYEAAWPLWGTLRNDQGRIDVLHELEDLYRATGQHAIARKAAVASIDYYAPVEAPAVTLELPGPGFLLADDGTFSAILWPRINFDIGFNLLGGHFRFGPAFAVTGARFEEIRSANFAGLRLSYRLGVTRKGPVPTGAFRLAFESLQSVNTETRLIGPTLIYERGMAHYSLRLGRVQNVHESFLSKGEKTFVQFTLGLNLFDIYRLFEANRFGRLF